MSTYKKLLFLTSLFVTILFFSQKKKEINERTSPNGYLRCYSTQYEKNLQKKNNKRASKDSFENWIATRISKQKSSNFRISAARTIPVVVHVINKGEAVGTGTNISDAQILSQITTLNNDYRKKSGTKGYNTNPVGADANIEFALAVRDPNGNPTNGIDRITYCQEDWNEAEVENILKPNTIWDPTKYLNFWIVNFGGDLAEFLGYAQFPDASTLDGLNNPVNVFTANTDGVVIGYKFFGNLDYNDGTFNLHNTYAYGRTATHEVGHWLGLRHIWGDENCGNDFVADTPIHQDNNYGCFTHPKPNSCGTVDEMFENYMDYTDDACMNVFTVNQVDRFNAVLSNSPRRKELLTSNALSPVAIPSLDAEIQLNDVCAVSDNCKKASTKVRLINKGSSAITSAIISINDDGYVYTKNWTGNLAPFKETLIDIALSGVKETNSLSANITSINNTTDNITANNADATTYKFGINDSFNVKKIKLDLQLDRYGTETTWSLKDNNGNVLYSGGPYEDYADAASAPLKTFIFDLNYSDCYKFEILDSEKDGICCDYGNGYYKLSTTDNTIVLKNSSFDGGSDSYGFNLRFISDTVGIEYNPLKNGEIILTKINDNSVYKIYNMVGQLLLTAPLYSNVINVSTLPAGIYLLSLEDNSGKIYFKSQFIKK